MLLWRSAGQEEYTREGIDWEFIEFRDNQAPLLYPFAFACPCGLVVRQLLQGMAQAMRTA